MSTFIIIFIILSMVGCSHSKIPKTTVDNTASISTPSPTQNGKTETFSYGGLKLEVTNVREIKTESKTDDMGKPREYRCLFAIQAQEQLFLTPI